MLIDLEDTLKSIDELLDSYDFHFTPDRPIGEIFRLRSKQNPLLDEVILSATNALKIYPYNPQLLDRRARAKILTVTANGQFPLLDSAEEDYRLLLYLDPNNYDAAAELLNVFFTYSEIEDLEIAKIAEELASNTEQLLIQLRGLQIKALGYADQHDEAVQVFKKWSSRFPGNAELLEAIEDARSMR